MIYCVEDDKSIQNIEVYTLKNMGFEALGLDNFVELEKALEKEIPKLIILDIMLSGEDGISILKKLKSDKKTADIPIIMATANGKDYDKIEALDLGADDYLVKPFSMLEMVSRVKAVLRRCEKEVSEDILVYEKISIDINARSVKVSDEKVVLTLKEYELLKLMLLNQGRVFSREELLNIIWDLEYIGESRTVDVHIRTLRHKLGVMGSCIKTVRGVGYSVERI